MRVSAWKYGSTPLTPATSRVPSASCRDAGFSAWTRGELVEFARVLGFAVRRGWIGRTQMRRLARGERPRVERREMRISVLGGDRAAARRGAPELPTVDPGGVPHGAEAGRAARVGMAGRRLRRPVIRVRKQLDRSGRSGTAAFSGCSPLARYLQRLATSTCTFTTEAATAQSDAAPSSCVR